MANLTTRTRFKNYAGITGTSKDSLVNVLIPLVSSQIERYLRRTLTITTYKKWYDGTGGPTLRLDDYPILGLYRVCVGSMAVATVTNSSASVAQAFVSCDGTSLQLVSVSTAGADTITEITLSGKTISTLETAIEAVSGWACTILSTDYNNLPASQLRPLHSQEAYDESLADLVMPTNDVTAKVLFEDQISVVNAEQFPSWDIFPGEQLPNRMSANQPGITPPTFSYGFPPGSANIFAWYKAGYTLPSESGAGTMPPGLELIVHQCVQDALGSTKVNSNLTSESLGDYSYSLRASADGAVASIIANRKKDLNQFRRVSA